MNNAMLEQAQTVQPELIASTLLWWEDAGVDALVDEVPTGWINKASAVEAAKPSRTNLQNPASSQGKAQVDRADLRGQPHSVPLELPKTIEDFATWLTKDWAASDAGPPSQRVGPSGDPNATIMVLIDMPEVGDAQAETLLSGDAGDLFDKMLMAIKQTRETIWLASLCPARPPGGQLTPEMLRQLMPIARHHIDLIGPKRLWLMGQTVSRALLGADAMPGTGCLQKINHEGRSVDAVASFSPRFLLQQPKRKAAAWADMQALVEGT